LTAFLGYKAGSTHVVREVDKLGSKMHKKEVTNPVTIVETPPLCVVGIVGYVETPKGVRALTTVWAQHLQEQMIRRFYKGWYRSKKKAFSKYQKQYASKEKTIDVEIERIKKYCKIVRVIVHTDIAKIGLKQKKAHVAEIQINGGSVAEKVDLAVSLLEKTVPVDSVFAENDVLDVVGITKGRGNTGVTHRWGTAQLARKSHRGLRKVACIGAWHPAKVSTTVPRAGQDGNFHRTERNKKVFKIGKGEDKQNATLENDVTSKRITPLGGFISYGNVDEDFVMLKGSIPGPRQSLVTMRKTLLPQTFRDALEKVQLKFIDTSSNAGTGRFQTRDEKRKIYGYTKNGLYSADP